MTPCSGLLLGSRWIFPMSLRSHRLWAHEGQRTPFATAKQVLTLRFVFSGTEKQAKLKAILDPYKLKTMSRQSYGCPMLSHNVQKEACLPRKIPPRYSLAQRRKGAFSSCALGFSCLTHLQLAISSYIP